MFVKGAGYDNMTAMARETRFIQMLEGIHPDDAVLLVAILEGRFDKAYEGVDESLFRAAWPDLLPPLPETPSDA